MDLPEYEKPPVREVVLGVHFKLLEGFGGPYVGLLWREFRQQFGKIEEQPLLIFRLERFGIPEVPEPPVTIDLLDKMQPRIWLVNDQGTELLQVQQDWFSHNWRKLKDDDEYPRYSTIRASFQEEIGKLSAFLQREQLGALVPVQCEITYVNNIPEVSGENLEDLLTVFTNNFSDGFLRDPENPSVNLRFVMKEAGVPYGRLHIAAVPIFMTQKGVPGYRLTLTARGKLEGDDLDSILAFLDKGHEWIVRGFTSITTATMHEKWKRTK